MLLKSTSTLSLLFIGDVIALVLSLWLMLFLRYAEIPAGTRLTEHFATFAPLFLVWLLVFYMAGLYGKHILLLKSSVLRAILQTQFLNIVLAAIYFFVVPNIGIAPKTNLILYLVISLGLIFSWRFLLFPLLSRPSNRECAVIIGKGAEVEELVKEVNSNERYHLAFVLTVDPWDFARHTEVFMGKIREAGATSIVVDSTNADLQKALPAVYELSFTSQERHFLDFYKVYEEVFDRVPLSLLHNDWFVKNVSSTNTLFYAVSKRAIDIVGGLAMGVITVVLTPLIACVMWCEGPGPIFIAQDRIGQFGKRVKCYKFRSMRFNKQASREWTTEEKKENPITKVGGFLRRTSLDEFPQFINILTGDISLIGPRNDVEGLGKRLGEAIAYYHMRYAITPGITGWAQINQQYEQGNISPQSIEETKTRLAYDFYYIKNRSLPLDIEIALKTVKRMLFRVSSR